MDRHGWTVTVDMAFPTGAGEIADQSIDMFLDLISPYRGALNLGRFRRPGLAVTLSINAEDLDEATFRNAADTAEAIVREHLEVLGLGDDWTVDAIEVSANDESRALYLLPLFTTK